LPILDRHNQTYSHTDILFSARTLAHLRWAQEIVVVLTYTAGDASENG